MKNAERVLHIINSTMKNDMEILISQIDEEFSTFNINSILFITIIVAIEEEFNFEFDDEMLLFTAFPTIRSMVEYVERKIFTNWNNS